MIDKLFPHSYNAVLEELVRRLKEPAPGRIQVLSGPRQVGKTHLLREIECRHRGAAIYAAADAPAAALSDWWEAQWHAAERLALGGKSVILLLDEIQYLPDWGRRLKAEVDRIRHTKARLHVVASGSSSLRLGQGTRETMAGRFERLQLLHWPARELTRQFSLDGATAATMAVTLGTYPGAFPYRGDRERTCAYIRDAIIEPAVGRDIMAMETIRRPALLRQIFALAARHPAEIVSLQKLQGQLADSGALATISHYLSVLEEAYLVAAIPKFSLHEVRRRSAPPKLVPLNNGILAALSVKGLPQGTRVGQLNGRWIENACIAHAWNAGQSVWYWRQEPMEVDLVISGSWGNWAVEVKTGAFGVRELAGLLRFCKEHREYTPLVVCGSETQHVAEGAGITACNWQDYLLSGPPR